MSSGRIANALSDFRLIVSVVGSIYLAFTEPNKWWFLALGVIIFAAFTDTFDGQIARMGTPAANGKKKNEVATGALSILLPGAILIHQFIGVFWLDWPGSKMPNLIVWLVMCIVFVVFTIFVFNRARSVLVPDKAERFEVCQAWFTAMIVVACAYQIFQLAWYGSYGVMPPFDVFVGFEIAVVIGLLIAAMITIGGENRLLNRTDELNKGLYTGTKHSLFGKN